MGRLVRGPRSDARHDAAPDERSFSLGGAAHRRERSWITGPSTAQRLEYVAALANIRATELPIRGDEYRSVRWENAASLANAIQDARRDVERRFAQLLRQLVQARVMDREETADVQSTIEVTVHDERKDRSIALGWQ